jgi:hypothetical protein
MYAIKAIVQISLAQDFARGDIVSRCCTCQQRQLEAVTPGNFGLATHKQAIRWLRSAFAASQATEAVVRLCDGTLQKLLYSAYVNFDFSSNCFEDSRRDFAHDHWQHDALSRRSPLHMRDHQFSVLLAFASAVRGTFLVLLLLSCPATGLVHALREE